MRRMRTVAVTAIALTSLLVAGCGASDQDGGSTAGTQQITMWARDSEKNFINLLADAYNASQSAVEVTVSIIPAGTYVQKLGTGVANGTGPDVASIDLIYTPYFASRGALKDITDRADALPYRDGLSEAHLKEGEYDGRLYALPFTAEASVLYYNKTLFSRAGLDPEKPPTTYEEMLDAATRVRALGGDVYGFTFAGQCGGCNIFEFGPHIWASGGDVLSADGTTVLFDSSEVTDALTLWQSMWKADAIPPAAKTDDGSNMGTLFKSGNIGMVPLGAFFSQEMAQIDTFDWGITGIPGKDGSTASFAGGDNIAITSTSTHEDAAWDFIAWATSEAGQKVLADNSITPVRTDLFDTLYYPKDPNNVVFGEALLKGHTPYSVVENAVINDNNGPWARLISEAVFGDDVEAAQAKAQTAAQEIVDRGAGS